MGGGCVHGKKNVFTPGSTLMLIDLL